MHFVSEQRVPRRIRRSAVRWRKGLDVASAQGTRKRRGSDTPRAGCRRQNDVCLQGSVAQGGTARDTCGCCRSRSPETTDAPENAMVSGLCCTSCANSNLSSCRCAHLDQMRTVHAPGSPVWSDETAPPRLYDRGIGSIHRCRCLRSQTVFRLTEKLLHQVDTFTGDAGARWELQGLLPVQNLLPRDMPLKYNVRLSVCCM